MEGEEKGSWIFVVTGMFITIVVLAFARLSYGVILPNMKEGLNITYKEAGLLGTATSLGYLVTLILAGIAATKWGGKKTVLTGVSLVTVGFIGLTFSTSYWFGLLFMFLLGIGTSFTYTPLISLLMEWFPGSKGLVIGFLTSGVGVGILFTGMIVPYLTNIYPDTAWRMTWGLFATIGMIVVIMTLLFMKNRHGGGATGRPPSRTPPQLIYKNPGVILCGGIYGIIGLTYTIQMIFLLSFMLDNGLDIERAGQLTALNGIISIFSGPIWGFVSDRVGRRTALIIAMGANLIATVTPLISPNLFGFAVNTVIIGCTLNGLFTLIQAVSTEQVKPQDIPLAFSYVTFYFAVGQLIGPTIAGWLIDDWGGFKGAFLFSAIFITIGLYLTTRLKTVPHQQIEPSSLTMNTQQENSHNIS